MLLRAFSFTEAFKTSKSVLFGGKSANENQFLRPNSVEDVSNISQSARNIIPVMNDQNHILDIKKAYKGHLEKRSWTPPKKRNSHMILQSRDNFCQRSS